MILGIEAQFWCFESFVVFEECSFFFEVNSFVVVCKRLIHGRWTAVILCCTCIFFFFIFFKVMVGSSVTWYASKDWLSAEDPCVDLLLQQHGHKITKGDNLLKKTLLASSESFRNISVFHLTVVKCKVGNFVCCVTVNFKWRSVKIGWYPWTYTSSVNMGWYTVVSVSMIWHTCIKCHH